MKKAIVAVPYLSGKGGTETVIKNFHEAVTQYGDKDYSWKLVSYGGTKYSDWMKKWNKKVYNFSNSRYIQMVAYILLLPFLIFNTLKKEKPDFFIATNPIIWSIAFQSRKYISPKTKIISWYHFSFKKKNVKPRYLKKCDIFWAISSGIKDELLSLGVAARKIQIIYNPVDVNNHSSIKRSKGQNRFIYIGRIDYSGQKNVSELIYALNNVKDNWKCDIYGFVDNETKDKLLSIASKKTKQNIKFKGFYTDVWNEIDEADVLILTSKYEGLPMVLCEGASRGVYLVASDCPTGVKDVVSNKEIGRLYVQGNSKELSNLLNDILNFRINLPSQNIIIKAIKKFDYRSYSARIFKSLIEES